MSNIRDQRIAVSLASPSEITVTLLRTTLPDPPALIGEFNDVFTRITVPLMRTPSEFSFLHEELLRDRSVIIPMHEDQWQEVTDLFQEIVQIQEMLSDSNGVLYEPSETSRVDIKKLPRAIITKSMIQENPLVCSVCLVDMSLHDVGVKLMCTHIFHEACLRPWFVEHVTCPHCRYDCLSDEKFPGFLRPHALARSNSSPDLSRGYSLP